jgi:hypothetical protein
MKLKIAICVPCYGNPEALFTQSLVNMVSYFYRARLQAPDGTEYEKEIETFIVSSSMLTEVRHKLVAEALKWGADYMMCLDADHTFPEDTLDRLLEHNAMVVGANYVRRSLPTAPTAAMVDKQGDGIEYLLYTTAEKAAAGILEPAAHVGMGCVLINMKLFDVLQLDAEQRGEKSFMPLFKFEPASDGRGMRGEDVYFFEKVRRAGVPVFVDHAVSWNVGHVHQIIMTHQHAHDQRDTYRQVNKDKLGEYLPPGEKPDAADVAKVEALNARLEGAAA